MNLDVNAGTLMLLCIVGPLPASLALRDCHGLSAAVGLRFLTFVYSS